jgi:hypothetical protein
VRLQTTKAEGEIMTNLAKTWFDVDKSGLAKLLERRGRAFAVIELVQNAWDTGATEVSVSLKPDLRSKKVALVVSDNDPDGFKDLRHAWTLFAESSRKVEAEKRGRFNLGEKLVLALCDEAVIKTTTGTVIFEAKGRRRSRSKTDKGSVFTATLDMSSTDVAQVDRLMESLVRPAGVATTYNGKALPERQPVRSFEATLATEIADADGNMRRTTRKTVVRVFERWDETQPATLYELGIPVVALANRFHVDVGQKIPLNMDRDNTTPAYVSAINTLVLNATHDILTKDDVTEPWARMAAADEKCSNEAITKILDLRYGKNRVSFDPSDLEANKIAVSHGMTVIASPSMSKGEWDNARRADAIKPAGAVTPSPKVLAGKTDGDEIAWADMTETQRIVVRYSKDLALDLISYEPDVKIARANNAFNAWFGARTLTFNVQRLGIKFFNNAATGTPQGLADLHELLLHELAHEKVADHLSEEFHDECCRLGAKLAQLAIRRPDMFEITKLGELVR